MLFRWGMRRRAEPRCGSGCYGVGLRVGLLACDQAWAGGWNAFGVFSGRVNWGKIVCCLQKRFLGFRC